MNIIRNLNQFLEIKNSFEVKDTDIVVKKENINKCIEYFEQNKKEIYATFRFKDRMKKDAKFVFKNTKALIDKLYDTWTGSGFKGVDFDRKGFATSYLFCNNGEFYDEMFL